MVRVILSDRIRSLNWQVQEAEYIASLPKEVIAGILQDVRLLLTDWYAVP
ncbi:toxin-antitoxin system, toxin component, MazF family protein [Candidatus Caldatribacterium sp. SIUC1]